MKCPNCKKKNEFVLDFKDEQYLDYEVKEIKSHIFCLNCGYQKVIKIMKKAYIKSLREFEVKIG